MQRKYVIQLNAILLTDKTLFLLGLVFLGHFPHVVLFIALPLLFQHPPGVVSIFFFP